MGEGKEGCDRHFVLLNGLYCYFSSLPVLLAPKPVSNFCHCSPLSFPFRVLSTSPFKSWMASILIQFRSRSSAPPMSFPAILKSESV